MNSLFANQSYHKINLHQSPLLLVYLCYYLINKIYFAMPLSAGATDALNNWAQTATNVLPAAPASHWDFTIEYPTPRKNIPRTQQEMDAVTDQNRDEIVNAFTPMRLRVTQYTASKPVGERTRYGTIANTLAREYELVTRQRFDKFDLVKSHPALVGTKLKKYHRTFCTAFPVLQAWFLVYGNDDMPRKDAKQWIGRMDTAAPQTCHYQLIAWPYLELCKTCFDPDMYLDDIMSKGKSEADDLFSKINLFNFLKQHLERASKNGIWSFEGLQKVEADDELEDIGVPITRGVLYDWALIMDAYQPGLLVAAEKSGRVYLTGAQKAVLASRRAANTKRKRIATVGGVPTVQHEI